MIELGLFGLFGLTLLGLAVFPGRALAVSLAGLIAIMIARIAGTDFQLLPHLRHEAPLLINLLGLLTGFAVLADHFEASRLPLLMPAGFRTIGRGLSSCWPWFSRSPASWTISRTRRQVLPPALKGAGMLLALVLCASLMPVHRLPAACWHTILGLGFLSAVFDNIPLTRLALLQGGYDWGFVAYAVGVGGSMMWFGSSAGVALAGVFPQARSVDAWCRSGWHVAMGYVLGFLVMLACVGRHPRAVSGSVLGAPPAGSEE